MGFTKHRQNPNCLFLKIDVNLKRDYDLQFCMNSGSRLLQGLLFRLPVSLPRFAEFLVKVMNGCSNVCSISNAIKFISIQSRHSHLYFILSWYGCVLQAQTEVVLAPALIRKIESCQNCCTMCMKNQAHSETFSA